MGNASSMLTQYDIEEVQDHCNNLCEFLFLSWFYPSSVGSFVINRDSSTDAVFGVGSVSQQEIVSLYERFCQLDRNAKGFISADEFLSVPEFAMNPLSQVVSIIVAMR